MTEQLNDLIVNTGLIFMWLILVGMIIVAIVGAVIGAIWFFKHYWKRIWNGGE